MPDIDIGFEVLSPMRRLFFYASYITETEATGLPLALRIGVIVNTLLMLVGIVFLIITVYSGIMWITAAGSEEKIELSQKRIKRAFIGLVIVVGSWFITYAILHKATFGPARQPGVVRGFIQ